jgi:ornithine--oxo-acid transaminase
MSFAAATGRSFNHAYAEDVNPQWVRLLNLLKMNVQCDDCMGCELFATDERRIPGYPSGCCMHNRGHNHPAIIAAFKDKLDRRGLARRAVNV